MMLVKQGICCICSQNTDLTFEHVPPRKALNNSSNLIAYKFDVASHSWKPSTQYPYGVGEYTLCAKCNNETGGIYGQAYCDFIGKLAPFSVQTTSYRTQLDFSYKGYLCRILKQIMAMFCSINGNNFVKKNPEVRDFILNRKSQTLPKDLRVYIFLMNRLSLIKTGLSSVINTATGDSIICSEILFWPIGLLMAYSDVKNNHIDGLYLTEITHWKDYKEDKRIDEDIILFKNYKLLAFPMNYESKDEIEQRTGTPIQKPGIFPFLDYEI